MEVAVLLVQERKIWRVLSCLQMLNIMISQSSTEGWKLTTARRKLLAEMFPAAAQVLQHLVSAEDSDEAAELYYVQRLHLAALWIPVAQRAARYDKLSRLEFSIEKIKLMTGPQTDQETYNVQPHELVTQDYRRFKVYMKAYRKPPCIVSHPLNVLMLQRKILDCKERHGQDTEQHKLHTSAATEYCFPKIFKIFHACPQTSQRSIPRYFCSWST